MPLRDVAATLAEVPDLLRLSRDARPRPLATRDCLAARLEQTVSRFPGRTAVIFEGRSLSWRELNELGNRYAAVLRTLALQRGTAVSVIMENRVEFLAALIALNKLGLIAALINTNLTGRSLSHCLQITASRACIFGEELQDAVAAVRDDPALAAIEHYLFVPDSQRRECPLWASDLELDAAGRDTGNPAETGANTLGDTALYIFTSGTTGLPKASVISNRRLLLAAAAAFRGGLRCSERDRIYLCLPLYHGTGLFLGVGSAFATGASLFLRRRFSASSFLAEVRAHQTNCFIYIGELCRYLLNTAPADNDGDNPLTRIMGNGLRPDIWHAFKHRFAINRIAEFYGSSEGNAAFVNVLNKDCTVGMSSVPVALVRYDVDADSIVRDGNGRCIPVAPGETGLLLGRITEHTAFEGYTCSEATERKVLRNVLEDGDAWFDTGDLMKTIDVGFSLGFPHYQFVDRVGDTFRWKSENVSTNEVGEILNGHPQIDFCNVYGVEIPGADGRAGMAALVLAPGVQALDLAGLSDYVNSRLPAYARPVFLRVLSTMDTTATFKLVKAGLRQEGYDARLIRDPLYVMKHRSTRYERLDESYLGQLRDGSSGF